MTNVHAQLLPPLKGREITENTDSARGAIRIGIAILVVFFFGFGGWATFAPLNGAVVADAVVKVEGNRKSVQHLDGGIVKEIRVAEGDQVSAGDVLIALDDTQARAEHDVLKQQSGMLRAQQARLQAEATEQQIVDFPSDLLTDDESYAKMAIAGQRREFETRRISLSGQKEVFKSRIAELAQQISGNESQLSAYDAQLRSVADEEASLSELLEKGLISRTRLLQLQRTEDGLKGQIGSTEGAVATAQKTIEGYQEQIAQLDRDRLAEVSKDLNDTQTKLLDVTSRLVDATAVLARTQVRAPYSGTVVGLNVFGVGSVIQRGEKILDIVPGSPSLVVESRVRVQDISEVHPGMDAEIHLTAYDQRTTPVIRGKVDQISADRLTDERTGIPYYVATVKFDQPSLEANPDIKLYPGMPATVMITTKERTALDYLLGPFLASFDNAFKER